MAWDLPNCSPTKTNMLVSTNGMPSPATGCAATFSDRSLGKRPQYYLSKPSILQRVPLGHAASDCRLMGYLRHLRNPWFRSVSTADAADDRRFQAIHALAASWLLWIDLRSLRYLLLDALGLVAAKPLQVIRVIRGKKILVRSAAPFPPLPPAR
jgi:hypothetical protein